MAERIWRRFGDLDQLPSASEQLPPARTIAREELYGADLGSFGPFCAGTYLRRIRDSAE
jgi:hypothetical protein